MRIGLADKGMTFSPSGIIRCKQVIRYHCFTGIYRDHSVVCITGNIDEIYRIPVPRIGFENNKKRIRFKSLTT